ncbi:MAG: DUF6804 family protein [Candidatus Omnitrophota bacterium]
MLILVAIIMLFLDLASFFSAGYDVLVRFVVCLTAFFLIIKSKKLKKTSWMWTMVLMAILFNPFLPVRLDRVDLVLAKVMAICLFITSLIKVKKEEEPPNLNIKVVKLVIGVLFITIIVTVSLYCYFLKQKYLP